MDGDEPSGPGGSGGATGINPPAALGRGAAFASAEGPTAPPTLLGVI
jgi:hypothetical protein